MDKKERFQKIIAKKNPNKLSARQIKRKNSRKPILFDYQEVEDLAALGLAQAQIARCLGISEGTLYNNKRNNNDFAEAIARGRALAERDAAKRIRQAAMNEQNPDWRADAFFLKTRCGWREGIDAEVQANVKADVNMQSTVDITTMSNSELMKLVQDAARLSADAHDTQAGTDEQATEDKSDDDSDSGDSSG